MKTFAKNNKDKTTQLQPRVEERQARAAQQSTSLVGKHPQAQVQATAQQMADASPQANEITQLQTMANSARPNRTGLPDDLKAGVENLSGYSMDNIKVHYNSDKPATLQAHAFAQGTDIHVAPGQEKHLPHETWHVVQQKQGRVQPTMQMKVGLHVNDDKGLEQEADVMGERARQFTKGNSDISASVLETPLKAGKSGQPILAAAQLMSINGVEITEESSVDKLIEAAGWTKNYGLAKSLKEDEKTELIRIINLRIKKEKDAGILELMLDDLTETSSSSDEEKVSDGQEDPFDHGSFQSTNLDDEASLRVEFGLNPLQDKRGLKTAEAFGWEGFAESYKGYRKIGVHETTADNAKGLAAQGPSVDKMDTGHHLGKGRGFYVTPVGKKKLKTVTSDIIYGEQFVAIYISDHVTPIRSEGEDTNHTDRLDAEHGDKLCYYIMSGGGEIVIPERCFPFVKAVTLKDQLKQIPKESDQDRLALEDYKEQLEFAKRMNDLSIRYKEAKYVGVKALIAKQWRFLENILFDRWTINSREFPLWLDVSTIDQFVRPTPPSYRSNE